MNPQRRKKKKKKKKKKSILCINGLIAIERIILTNESHHTSKGGKQG